MYIFLEDKKQEIMDSGDCFAMNYNQNQLPLTVGILIFDQVEVLDVAGPFEVFFSNPFG